MVHFFHSEDIKENFMIIYKYGEDIEVSYERNKFIISIQNEIMFN